MVERSCDVDERLLCAIALACLSLPDVVYCGSVSIVEVDSEIQARGPTSV